MADPVPPPPPLRFGPYRLDVEQAKLTCDGTPVALRPKAFELLAALASRPAELVTKDELLDRVWGRRFITEGVIKSIVGELRQALEDDPKAPRWIETVPRRGYRFVGPIEPEIASPLSDAPAGARGNIPASLPATVGRDETMVIVEALHATHRLLTITGPSGIGKTRVALALADRTRTARRDGAWFVPLASLAVGSTDVATLCGTVAGLLRLDAAAGTDAGALARALRSFDAILVLDNAEHVLRPVAQLVATLMAEVPTIRIVVTSQVPLKLEQEQVYRLPPLALPAPSDDDDPERLMASGAVQLFVQRVSSRLQGFVLAPPQRKAIATLCRALDGLPLALELAAARVPLLGVHGIAELLIGENDGRLRLLTNGAQSAAPRQRTLRDAIAWSYDLLDDRQQRVFRRLGIFSATFSLRAAQAVCSDATLDAWSVLDALDALVDKSLLEALDVNGERRFRLLESLRAFAFERLVEADDEEATRDRHLQAAVVHWCDADDRSRVEPALPWLARHLPELDDLRAALRWADARGRGAELAMLVAGSTALWCRAGLGAEGRHWCERADAVRDGTTEALAAGLDLAVATLALYTSAYPSAQALPFARRAADRFESIGDAARAYVALYMVVQLAIRAKAVLDRSALLQRMAQLESARWNDIQTRFLRSARAYETRLAGDSDGYRALVRAELARCRAAGAVSEGWVAAHGLMLAEHDVGRRDEAVAIGTAAMDEIRAAGRLRQHAVFAVLWSTMLAEQGDVVRTRAAFDDVLPILRGMGSAWMAHPALGWLATHDGRDDDAARVLGCHLAAIASGTAEGSGAFVARSTQELADRLAARLGDAAFVRYRDEGGAMDDGRVEAIALGAR